MNTTQQEFCDIHCLDRIAPLLTRPKERRGPEWLEVALQTAVSVEFSTIPPYLCALWSIKDQMHAVATSIRNVVQEEMLHMALACNMLTGIGGVPQINDPKMVPSYPGQIPGGVHPELVVSLAGLSDATLDTFIAIEAPSTERGPETEPPPGRNPETSEQAMGYKTIGAFYEAIRDEFRTIKPELSTERQVSGPLAFIVMADLHAVEAGIDLIVNQGEGSKASPEVKRTHELAHYYRFLEIKHRKRINGYVDGQPIFTGEPVDLPDAWPMAVVPKGGYLRKDVPSDVWTMVNGFDKGFTQLLDQLQVVWEHGDQAALVHALETMFGLSEQAGRLMSVEIGKGRGNYGPCFRIL
jgi:hypothetical protein